MKSVENFSNNAKEKGVTFASSFGERAAEAFGERVQQTLEKAVKDLKPIIEDSAKKSSIHIKEGLMNFGEQFKVTGIEGFTGYAIERGFAQLGQNFELALYNVARSINFTIEKKFNESTEILSKDAKQCFKESTETLSKTGEHQMKVFKEVYGTELKVLQICLILCTLSLIIIALSLLFQLSPFKEIGKLILEHSNLLFIFTFAFFSYLKLRNENIKLLFIVIGGTGFMIGSLIREITFTNLNYFIVFTIFSFFIVYLYKEYALIIATHAYRLYKEFNHLKNE